MRYSLLLLFFAFAASLTSCRKDFDTVQNPGGLEFSKQTVYLDTVFTNIGSSTYMLKVYNRSKEDITIPTIKLGNAYSRYRLMIDGMNGSYNGKNFNNVELLAKDSLFIFIEVTADVANADPDDFLYTDEIQFFNSNGYQKVDLVTLIQDAVFLYPTRFVGGGTESLLLGIDTSGSEVRINGFELDDADPILHTGDEFVFTAEKPYVIYGYAGVPDRQKLRIEPGARIHFHADSGIIVQPGAQISIEGQLPLNPAEPLGGEIIFEGDRLEPGFSDTPGQWGTIWLREGSIANFNHCTIKNAVVGILAEGAQLNIRNTQIYNSSNIGLLGRGEATNIVGENVVANLAGQAVLACSWGGTYKFTHCTFNNNWNSSKQVAVSLDNYYEENGVNMTFPLSVSIYNSIIYGSNQVEYVTDLAPSSSVPDISLESNLFRFDDSGTALENDISYNVIRLEQNGNRKNQDPGFLNANKNKLNINTDSNAAGKGNAAFANTPTLLEDILGLPRNTFLAVDLGAYTAQPFP